MTRGFGDLLEIGYQDRPRLFDLTVRKPPPLAERSVEVDERVAADGTVLVAPDAVVIRGSWPSSRRAASSRWRSACCTPTCIRLTRNWWSGWRREVGFVEISRSSAVAPLVKIVSRADTTVVDAYLNPVLREYLAGLERALPGRQIGLMTSAGGLKSGGAFRGFESVLSGPAGGVVGFCARRRGAEFDTGDWVRHGRHEHGCVAVRRPI